MIGNEQLCFVIVMREEGGAEISRIKSDPGNWSSGKCGVGTLMSTQWGVSAPVALAKGLTPSRITREQACNVVFLPNYWRAVGAEALAKGVDLVVVDMAYNGGVGAARKLLAKTLKTARTTDEIISTYSSNRLALFKTFKTWAIFGPHNWALRIARVEVDAHKMAGTPAASVAVHASAARSRATANAKAALMAPTTATAGAGMTSTNFDAMPPSVALALLGGLVLVGAAVTAVSYWKWRAQGVRAVALEQLSEDLHHG